MRRRAGIALVIVTALLLAAAAVAGYARTALVDEQEFTARAAVALDEADVRTVVAEPASLVTSRCRRSASLVRADTRLVVLSEQDGGARPWYLAGFSFAQDTPLGATRADQFRCRRFRGSADSPLFLVNHWLDTFPPSPSRNERIGGRVLQERLSRCGRRRGLLPNLIAVDFHERSDVVEVARRLNAARR